MADWQFGILVVLLGWIIWRTRVVAQTSPPKTPGMSRLDAIEYKRAHPPQESEESKKENFELNKGLAESDWDDSQFSLGRYYELGWGVAQDKDEAFRWYCKAAEQGNTDAQYRLARAYFEGDGVPVDYTKAYFWLKLRQMDNGVDAVGDLLDIDQRTEIENRCREWVKSHQAARAETLKAAQKAENGSMQ